MCTKISSPVSPSVIKPKPLVSLKNFTVPVLIKIKDNKLIIVPKIIKLCRYTTREGIFFIINDRRADFNRQKTRHQTPGTQQKSQTISPAFPILHLSFQKFP